MKFYGTLLALSVFHFNVWGTTAFLDQAPKALTSKGWKTTESLTTTFSYLGQLGGGGGDKAATVNGGANKTPRSATMDERAKALESRLAAIENSGRSRLATGAPSATGKGPTSTATRSSGPKANQSRRMLEKTKPVTVQGGSLKTFSYSSPLVERVQVVLATEGRPLDCDVELWQGPDNTPQRMRVYIEDGSKRPFNCVIETPRSPNTISIVNTNPLEFPLSAYVAAADSGTPGPSDFTTSNEFPRTIQGGALRTFTFDPFVESVQILLKTDGRPLNARVELLQGPNNNKQVVDLYSEDGLNRPFYAIIDTPGDGNVVRVVNMAPVEFPLTAWVEPYEVGNDNRAYSSEPVLGGDRDDAWGRSNRDTPWGRPW